MTADVDAVVGSDHARGLLCRERLACETHSRGDTRRALDEIPSIHG